MHASMLIGPYGKGKSHLLLVLLAIISLDGKNEEDKTLLMYLYEKIRKVDEEAAEYIDRIILQKTLLEYSFVAFPCDWDSSLN